jgi:hypothetical protein
VFSVERKRGCPNAPGLSGWLSALLMTGNLSNRDGPDIFLTGKPGGLVSGAFTPPQNGKPTSIAQPGKSA